MATRRSAEDFGLTTQLRIESDWVTIRNQKLTSVSAELSTDAAKVAFLETILKIKRKEVASLKTVVAGDADQRFASVGRKRR